MTILKRRLYFIFLILTLTFSIDVTGQITKINSITIADYSIIINKEVVFVLPFSPDSLTKYLGKPRIDPGSPNSIYFWDNLGVMGFVPSGTSTITSFEICISESNYYQTTTFYQGKILIADSTIDSGMTKYQFFSIFLKKETKDFMPKLTIGNMSVLIEFDEETNKLIGIAITKKDE